MATRLQSTNKVRIRNRPALAGVTFPIKNELMAKDANTALKKRFSMRARQSRASLRSSCTRVARMAGAASRTAFAVFGPVSIAPPCTGFAGSHQTQEYILGDAFAVAARRRSCIESARRGILKQSRISK